MKKWIRNWLDEPKNLLASPHRDTFSREVDGGFFINVIPASNGTIITLQPHEPHNQFTAGKERIRLCMSDADLRDEIMILIAQYKIGG